MWVHPLAESDTSCGGKAVGLARLIAVGLPVPDGFVIDDRAFRSVAGELELTDIAEVGHVLDRALRRIVAAELPADLPAAFADEVTSRARKLGMLAVRSSATIEDREAGAAAGVFSSQGALPVEELWRAIGVVWTSALTPLAATYAQGRGGAISIAVIVQRFVSGNRITVYTRPPNAPAADEIWVQRGEEVTRLRRNDGDPLVALVLRAEQAIGAAGGADIELVAEPGGTLWVVQARPIVHSPPPRRRAPPSTVFTALIKDNRRWTWDVAHNPDPLSPAQTSLVELVDRAEIAPWSMRVCAGYLYTAPRADPPPPLDPREVVERAAQLERQIDAILAGDPPLEEALDRYLAFYRLWANEVGPLIAAARATAPATAGSRPSAIEATLRAAAAGELDLDEVIARVGVMSPAWDVAVPTFAERPELVRDAIVRAQAIARPPRTDLRDAGADLAERDDVWFARAQWLVRRALRRRSIELGLADDDVYWLPFEELHEISPNDAHRRAAGERAAAERAARWSMPLHVPEDPSRIEGTTLRGVGAGERVTGRVVRFASLASAVVVGGGEIVVARAITPALAVFVVGCAAIVSESGGPLDHGASLARELGVPYVVGCHDAWTRLSDGSIVTVDGNEGTVTTAT